MSERRLLITGVGGFVGRHLARECAADGFRVFGIDRGAGCVSPSAGIETHDADIMDADRVRSIVHLLRPTHVAHLAASANAMESERTPDAAHTTNVLGSIHVMNAVAEEAADARFLQVSSGAVYAPPADDQALTEESACAPATHYGRTKLEAEERVATIAEAGGVDLLIARPFNHTGPGQSSDYVVSGFARQAAAVAHRMAPPLIRAGNLDVRRDFSDVRDVVRAYRLMLNAAPRGAVYNVASGVSRTPRAILEDLIRETHVAFGVVVDAERQRKDETPNISASAEAILRALGWRPEIEWTTVSQEPFR